MNHTKGGNANANTDTTLTLIITLSRILFYVLYDLQICILPKAHHCKTHIYCT